MSNQRKHLIVSLGIAALMSAIGQAGAVVVAPGGTIALPGSTSAAEPFLEGTVIEDEVIPFSLAVSPQNPSRITGAVQQRVVRENVSGTLDFYWRITELSGGSLGYLRVGQFVTPVYDANYRIDGLGDIGPASITRFTAGMGGATNDYGANFNFVSAANADSLVPGQSSKFMYLHTNATQYAKTAFFDIASTGTYTASAQFAAFAPVPEPTSSVLMLAGVCTVAGVALRRRARRDAKR